MTKFLLTHHHPRLLLPLCLLLAACSSDPQLLPDGGPTTKDIWQGNYHAGDGSTGSRIADGGYPVAGEPMTAVGSRAAMSSVTGSHFDELNQDFKEVPNPKILGYVYAHYNSTGMAVPGYFTSFRLYKVNHNALMREGAAEGWTR